MAALTYENWDGVQIDFPIDNSLKGSRNVLKWAFEEYGEEIVYACSFGIEGIVLIDLISKVNPNAKIVFLDTDFHFQETYELIEKVKKKYPTLRIEMQKPELTPEEQAAQYGEELWKSQPDLCCSIRKVEPLKKVLTGPKAWISGLRREQSETRRHVEFINFDNKFESIKVCPLIHWTEEDVWNYVKAFGLPYNTLHDKGYPSIGCEYCTIAVEAGQNSRAGRWASLEKTECGLHKV
ncbi:phosphoadenylyl-sulfate reductase [Domibacillus sp. DTU_2020_1001157_1_SI_ALB_TIR_016]|uniref:phosphoadenylyl-sulfate reductase n=1 Tax=Domibacillus sp. DTU_2020_1001157_1_SI_ALB_TIR_016 TaxID=3077789 RepID=UPI0028E64B63|nr:phosphoadenylyl-sulfate reductase [Domibacillus sp. DTU_2020_1001157_1_SI_ALB_TIR_016]WNS82151.1 phosphoadenylyl-sulfate reductase [Domibacillus sp. DTU_2020_1001157_1_SI_ALB_TIR_016]